MNKFEINVCPLCNKVLRYRYASRINIYECPTIFEFKSHYEVEYDDEMSIQHIVIGPWAIDNFSYGDKLPAARIYKMAKLEDGSSRWRFITEAPEIHADTEANMLVRINILVMFL